MFPNRGWATQEEERKSIFRKNWATLLFYQKEVNNKLNETIKQENPEVIFKHMTGQGARLSNASNYPALTFSPDQNGKKNNTHFNPRSSNDDLKKESERLADRNRKSNRENKIFIDKLKFLCVNINLCISILKKRDDKAAKCLVNGNLELLIRISNIRNSIDSGYEVDEISRATYANAGTLGATNLLPNSVFDAFAFNAYQQAGVEAGGSQQNGRKNAENDNPFDIIGVNENMTLNEIKKIFAIQMNALKELPNPAPQRRLIDAFKKIQEIKKTNSHI